MTDGMKEQNWSTPVRTYKAAYIGLIAMEKNGLQWLKSKKNIVEVDVSWHILEHETKFRYPL